MNRKAVLAVLALSFPIFAPAQVRLLRHPSFSNGQVAFSYLGDMDSRKALADQLSKGAIGYLHIRAMDAASLDKFQRDLLLNLDKKALIIDERFNGGGGIDQELLEILNQRKKYESYRGRNSVEIPRPVRAFFGPMAVLQNDRSASNAEMFPEGFRTLGPGKIIGVAPDVLIDNTPADFLAGKDRQIEKAIEVLRAQMK